MGPLLIGILTFALAAYFLASRFYAARVERWLGVDVSRPTAAVAKQDGQDFIPAKPYVLFAHHFAAIAGAGPIVGPTLALAYGYVPVILWLVAGAIFLGGVHDMVALWISTREGGRSIADIARSYLGQTGYALVVGFLVIGLFMITATFLNLSVTALTSIYPAEKVGLPPATAESVQSALATPADAQGFHTLHTGDALPSVVGWRNGEPVQLARIGGIASTSVLFITLVAPLLGWMIYRRKTPAWINYLVAALLCAVSVVAGIWHPVVVGEGTWRIWMTVYVLLASAVPVWLLLMPRDFVNVQILYAGIGAVLLGLVVAGLAGGFATVPAAPQSIAEMIPAWSPDLGLEQIGWIWPMLLITVSCGAASGFHCLVATGTSARQLACESHARRVGYSGMLLESLLAVAVVLTLLAGLDWSAYRAITFDAKNPILAISLATGNLIHLAFGLPVWCGTVLGILLIEGFVVTTLDVAVRLNRYLLEEVWKSLLPEPPRWLLGPWFNTALCAGGMFLLSQSNALPLLWQVFGSANQMMGAMALLIAAVWLRDHGRRWLFAAVPSAILFVTTFASLGLSLAKNLASAHHILVAACGVLILLGAGTLALGIRRLLRPSVADGRSG